MTKKEFTAVEPSGKEIKLAFRTPGHEEISEAEKIYASKVSALIREGNKNRLVLRQEVDKFLKESGIWTDNDEQGIQKATEYIAESLAKIKKGGIKLSEGRQLAISIMDKRKEIFTALRKRQILDDSTIEAVAENEKNDYIVFACTEFADDGQKYWSSFEDMKNDKLSDSYNKASGAAIEVIYGLNPNYETELPENKWLKKYKFIDEEMNYVDRQTGKRVDRDGKPIEDSEEKINQRVYNLTVDICNPESEFIDDTIKNKKK